MYSDELNINRMFYLVSTIFDSIANSQLLNPNPGNSKFLLEGIANEMTSDGTHLEV